MRVLLIGDIVGHPGRNAVKELLPILQREENVDFVIANAENAAGGSGVTPQIGDELFKYGIDVMTTGDHIWNRKEIFGYLEKTKNLLRPANYPKGVPGFGSYVINKKSASVGVINLAGRVFMEAIECPFRVVMEELKGVSKETNVIFVDIHAEATSEKVALGWYLDGVVSCVFGTHTHIQTADERILPKGTAYITDLGMTGPYDSVIGRRVDQILTRFITQLPTRFEMADENVQLAGALVEVDEISGKAVSIKRIQRKYVK
ncbi:MAG: TIGR00282 family metallophosphoesterase [Candidatus Omnitrophica bacterium]|nr:TIGR00282 family metallophosphoesterase [Candidatus Omnitrophota bacterium]